MPWSGRPALDNDQDATLFDRFLAGDDAAFVRFLERHNRRLYAYCLKMVGDPEAAQDVMQEVWERIIRLRTRGEKVGNPTSLLVRMVRNLSLNHLRDTRRHLSLDEISDEQHPDVTIAEPSYVEELAVIALERLPLQQREVIILHVYSGYNYIEIARMLEITVDNARMRAMRGRAHLARIVGALMAVEDDRIRNGAEAERIGEEGQ
jgi:RNA polymerase sigma-70 factor, ECF subfamily